MIRRFFISILLLSSFCSWSQQYPWWTQFRSAQTLLNPGFCGTKRLLDIRLNYRNQWTGYDGAPKTYALAINSRLLKGQLGVGGFIYKDEIGPFKNFSGSITGAYHLRFPDSELSFGAQGNFMSRRFDGNDITIRNQQDKAINQYTSDKASNMDVSFGIVYYNDRFHIGAGANNVAGSAFEFYKKDDSKMGKFTNVAHYNMSAGYNWADNPDFVFENTVLAVYVPSVPLSFEYNLRLHMKKQLMAGLDFRFNDAIALQVGYTIKDYLQISYSYDFVTSPLRTYQKGSHEVMIIFSSNLGTDKKKRGFNGRFLKQRFQYLLQ